MKILTFFALFLAAAGCASNAPGDGLTPHADASPGGSGPDGSLTPGADAAGPQPGPGIDGGEPSGGNCGSVSIDSSAKVIEQPGNVLVIFDRSLTMANNFTTPTGPAPRYIAAGDALLAAIEPLGDRVNAGAILFPSVSGTLFCTALVDPIESDQHIDFLPGTQFASAWRSYWQTHGLNFGTWINLAFERAEQALSRGTLEGSTAVVLFSDGEPVCQDGVSASEQAAQWQARGIPTHVVGLPGAIGSGYLSQVAQSGGQADFIAPSDSAVLQTELERIARSTVRRGLEQCALSLNPPPEDPSLVNLVVEDAVSGQRFEVPRDSGDWSLSEDGREAVLQGALCDKAKAGDFASITFEFGCVDLPPLII